MRCAPAFLVVTMAALAGCRDEAPVRNPGDARDAKDKRAAELKDRDEIAKRLPAGLKLEDRIPRATGNAAKTPDPASDPRKTLEAELLAVGAHLDKAGKLVDGEGREILFTIEVIPGKPDDGPRKFKDKPHEDQDDNRSKEKDFPHLEKGRRVIVYEIDIRK
jgi:hypothetical protein